MPVLYPSHRYTEAEQNMLKQMIQDKWRYHVKYHGTRAVAVVDLSDTGVIQWVNTNQSGFPADFHFAEDSKRFFAFEFRDGKWWLRDTIVPSDWPEFEEEYREWRALVSPSDNRDSP
jgi:hypothetical protein